VDEKQAKSSKFARVGHAVGFPLALYLFFTSKGKCDHILTSILGRDGTLQKT